MIQFGKLEGYLTLEQEHPMGINNLIAVEMMSLPSFNGTPVVIVGY